MTNEPPRGLPRGGSFLTFWIDSVMINHYILITRYGGTMKAFIKVMKALSDPNRVKMIKLLQRRVLCVCEIQKALGLAQSTVSKHLKVLDESELITYSKDGLWVNYRLSDRTNNPYAASLIGNLRHWLDEDTDVAALIGRLPEISRESICAR